MKNYIKSVCFALLTILANGLFAQEVFIPPGGPCPDINVSTGIDNTGNAIAVGATDPNWSIVSGPMMPAAKRVASYLPYWQPTPIAGTNACWINGSGTIFNNAAGIYVFERSFTIGAGTTSFTTNFGVAWDDVLVNLELIPPVGSPISLAVPPAPPYTVSPPIGYTQVAPAPGVWKIRATVNFIDNVGAFILSGTVDIDCGDNPCTCDNIHPTFTYTTDADCITTFVGTTNINCADFNIQYNWVVDGVPVGSGQVFSMALGNGSHTVCLQVTAAINGQICKREWCAPVNIECDPCTCDKIIPKFIFNIDKCEGHFTATPDLPCCVKEIKYDWYIDGNYVGTGQNFNYTFVGNGLHNVCLQIFVSLDNGDQCFKEICKVVEVTDCEGCTCDQLKPSFTFFLQNCFGVFDATVDAPDCMSNFTYEWYVNGMPAGTGPSMTYTFPFNGAYNVCVFVTATLPDGTICKKEFCKQVNVKDCDPCNCDQVELNYDVWTEKCDGHFTGLVGLPACLQIISWDWTVNGMPVGSGQTFSYTFPGNGVYNVCLFLTTMMPDGTLCHKKVCKQVTITDCDGCNCVQLEINFNWEIDKCNVHLYASAGGLDCGDVFYDYQWTWNGTPIGSGQNIAWTAPSNGTYTICLLVTATLPNGVQCHKEICKTFTVTDCDQCTCEGLTLGYNYQISQCVGHFNGFWTLPPCTVNYTVDWYVGGVFAGSGPAFAYTFPGNGVYQVCMVVTATLSNGTVCQDRYCRNVEVTDCVNCNCEQLTGIILYQVQGCVVTLNAQMNIPSCMTHPSYSWYVNGSYIGSGNPKTWSAPGSGTYTICVVVVAVKPNGQKCERQICKTIQVNCGIGTPTDPQGMAPLGPTMEESLSLYPNPASTELNIDFTTQEAGSVIISFKTMDGKEFLNQVKDLQAGDQHLKMPISPMVSDEMIFVEITTGSEKIIRKVSVSRN